MKELVSAITQRGQVTIPVEVRRLLGLKPRDRVAFEMGENEVKQKNEIHRCEYFFTLPDTGR